MRKLLVLMCLLAVSAAANAGGGGDLRKGNKAYDKEKYGEAFEYYNKAVENGEPEKGFYNSGAALYRLQDYDGALQAYDALKDSAEFKQDAYYNAANAYYNRGDSEAAVKSLRSALLLNREDKEALHNLQFILQEQQNQKNRQDKNDNQGDNKQQQDKQDNSDSRDKSGNRDQEEQDSEGENDSERKLSPSEADNILQMSKEHVNQDKRNMSAAGASEVEKDW